MAVVSPSSAAYARYVALGQRTVVTANIFPSVIAEIIGSYIATTKPEFYRFVLKNGHVVGIAGRRTKYQCALHIDDSLLIESEQAFYKQGLFPYDKFTIDVIFENNSAMLSKTLSWLCQSPEHEDSDLKMKQRVVLSTELYTSMRESFAREADLLMADMV